MKLFALVVALLLASLAVRAEEMEFDIDVDTVLICDKAEQVRRFVALFEGDVAPALHTVNAENNNTACDVARIAYVFVADVAEAKGPCGEFRVFEILLLGVMTGDEGFRPTVPATYFTMSPAERGADQVARRRAGDITQLVKAGGTNECRIAASRPKG